MTRWPSTLPEGWELDQKKNKTAPKGGQIAERALTIHTGKKIKYKKHTDGRKLYNSATQIFVVGQEGPQDLRGDVSAV